METQIIVALISSCLGGVIVAVVNHLLTRRHGEVEVQKIIAETKHIETITKNMLEEAERIREESSKELEKVHDEISLATQTISQVTTFKNYKDAFGEMTQFIINYLETCKKNNEHAPTVDLKLIAVAMTFSWEHFISTDLIEIINDYPAASFNISIAFVHHHYLRVRNVGSTTGINWPDICEKRLKDVQEFERDCKESFGNRVTFDYKTFHNLPHWHGWLVNNSQLYLGRTDWTFENHTHKLRVGQNLYRSFDDTNEQGEQRIELFKSWHRYYFEYEPSFEEYAG